MQAGSVIRAGARRVCTVAEAEGVDLVQTASVPPRDVCGVHIAANLGEATSDIQRRAAALPIVEGLKRCDIAGGLPTETSPVRPFPSRQALEHRIGTRALGLK